MQTEAPCSVPERARVQWRIHPRTHMQRHQRAIPTQLHLPVPTPTQIKPLPHTTTIAIHNSTGTGKIRLLYRKEGTAPPVVPPAVLLYLADSLKVHQGVMETLEAMVQAATIHTAPVQDPTLRHQGTVQEATEDSVVSPA